MFPPAPESVEALAPLDTIVAFSLDVQLAACDLVTSPRFDHFALVDRAQLLPQPLLRGRKVVRARGFAVTLSADSIKLNRPCRASRLLEDGTHATRSGFAHRLFLFCARFFSRASTALLAIRLRSAGVRLFARALPAATPSSCRSLWESMAARAFPPFLPATRALRVLKTMRVMSCV